MRTFDNGPYSTTLSITMTSRHHGLARVIGLLHRRGVHVVELRWTAPKIRSDGHAQMTVTAELEEDRRQNLRASLARLVEVLEIRDEELPVGAVLSWSSAHRSSRERR